MLSKSTVNDFYAVQEEPSHSKDAAGKENSPEMVS